MPESLRVAEAAQMEALGGRLAAGMCVGQLIFLRGDLGAGKTTLVRGVMRGLGHTGNVKSPTYTLLETYQTPGLDVYHFDLYRLQQPEELEYLAWRDYLGRGVCLVEWPQRGEPLLPQPDCQVTILQLPDQVREVRIDCYTGLGRRVWPTQDRVEPAGRGTG